MVPRRIRTLPRLPLNPNGKYDRKGLASYSWHNWSVINYLLGGWDWRLLEWRVDWNDETEPRRDSFSVFMENDNLFFPNRNHD